MNDMNKGYVGYSMSKRAAAAYEDDEMPKSKWSKAAMISRIEDYANDEDITLPAHVYKMNKRQLFSMFFDLSSWHHTSKFCNETDFYALDEDYFESNLEMAPFFTVDDSKRVRDFMKDHDFHFVPSGSTENMMKAINEAEDNPMVYAQYGYPYERSFNLNDPEQCALAIELDYIYKQDEQKFDKKWAKIMEED